LTMKVQELSEKMATQTADQQTNRLVDSILQKQIDELKAEQTRRR